MLPHRMRKNPLDDGTMEYTDIRADNSKEKKKVKNKKTLRRVTRQKEK